MFSILGLLYRAHAVFEVLLMRTIMGGTALGPSRGRARHRKSDRTRVNGQGGRRATEREAVLRGKLQILTGIGRLVVGLAEDIAAELVDLGAQANSRASRQNKKRRRGYRKGQTTRRQTQPRQTIN